MGQNKPKTQTLEYHYSKSEMDSILNRTTATISNYKGASDIFMSQPIIPTSVIMFADPNSHKPIITINLKKDGKSVGLSPDWDTMVFTMKKENFRWINDSTAVYIKK